MAFKKLFTKYKLYTILAIIALVLLVVGGTTAGVILTKQTNPPADALTGTVYINADGTTATSSSYDFELELYYSSTTATVCRLDSVSRSSGSTATTIVIPNTVTVGGSSKTITTMNNPTGTRGVFGSVRSYIIGVILPSTLTNIGAYAFSYCTNLASIAIPDSVTNIGKWAFNDCESLTSITIPDRITNIEDYAFSGCGFTSIMIPNSVTSIGNSAFHGCESLSSVTIPDSVVSIGDYAFYACDNLTSVTIGNGVTSIGNSVFRYCGKLTSISVKASNAYYSSSNGVLFNKNKTTLICYPTDKGGSSYTIPSTVTSIGDYAFWFCDLTSVTIPDGVTSIGRGAFYEAGLTSLTLPESVESIGESTFFSCAFTSVTIPDSVTSIGRDAFSFCSRLTRVTFKNELTSPSQISDYAFTNGNSNATYYFDRASTYNLALQNAHKFTTTNFVYTGPMITVNSNTGGDATGEGPYDIGATATLTATASTGYHFVNWTISGSGTLSSTTSATTTLTVSGDATITANFAPNTYTVTLDQQGGSGGTAGVTATYTSAMPSATAPNRTGYTFQGYFAQPNGQGTQYYTNSMASASAWQIADNSTIYAYWTINQYTITTQSSPSEYGTVSGGGTFDYNTQITLTATSTSGLYLFDYWDKDGTRLTGQNELSSTLNITVTGNATYTAHFRLFTYSVTIKTDASLGKVLFNNQLVDNITTEQGLNASLTLYAIPNKDVAFLGWQVENNTGSNVVVENPLNLTLTSDTTITALFTNSLMAGIGVSAIGGGQARIGGYEGDIDDNTYVVLNAICYTGYIFDGWYIMENGILTKIEALGNNTAVTIKATDYDGKLIIARFVPNSNSNVNEDVNN